MMTALRHGAFGRCLLVITFGAVGLTGCEHTADRPGQPEDFASQLSFDYEQRGESGFMDQTLAIINGSGSAVVLDAAVVALNSSGVAVPGVTVESVYGSHNARQVLMPGENIDVLMFKGENASQVRDVRVTARRATVVDTAAVVELVEAVPIGRSGEQVGNPAELASVSLRNPNDADVKVGVAYIIWDQPGDGESQQASQVVSLSDGVTVPAHGKAELEVAPSARRVIAKYASSNASSLKAYFTR